MIELPIEFKNNIINRYEEKGEKWLEDINGIIDKYIKKFNLSNVKLVENLSMNVVLQANSSEYGEVIMKVGTPTITTMNEINYIRLSSTEYIAKCYYYNLDDRVMILEKINPGYYLSKNEDSKERIRIFCDILNNLVTEDMPQDGFKFYDDEFMGRIELVKNNKEQYKDILYMLDTASKLYKEIKNMNLPKYVLHEDLQHKNILKSKNGWKAIDPHGTIAEKFFETVMFIKNESIYNGLDKMDEIVTSVSKSINEDKNLIYKACYTYLFSKTVYCIKIKYKPDHIKQNIKICDKILEYLKK